MSAQTSSSLHGRPIVKGFCEKHIGSVPYVVADPETKQCHTVQGMPTFGLR